MERAYGLYTHIRANQTRSIVLLVGLFFLLDLLVFAGALMAESGQDATIDVLLAAAWVDFVAAFPWATLGTAVWIAIAYQFHQRLIDAVTGGHEVTRQEEPRLYNLLENLCVSRGMATPRLKLIDSPALNAFATGLNQRQYAISVTTALRDALDDAELEAVLGHELTHIRNGDVRLMVVAAVIAGVISFFGELVFRAIVHGGLGGRGRRNGGGDRKTPAGLASP